MTPAAALFRERSETAQQRNSTAQGSESSTAPDSTTEVVGAVAATPEPSSPVFTPVLAFGSETVRSDETALPAVPAPIASSGAPTEQSEIESITDIFETSDAAPSAKASSLASAENISAAQGRWKDRRRKAMEQAKAMAEIQVEEAAAFGGDAPIIAPMQSVPEEVRKRGDRPPRKKPDYPVSLAFADLSGRYDLEPEEIEEATEIYGIKYPRSFDASKVNFAGRAIDYSNFSLVDKLKWEYIKDASDITGVVFPSTFDVDNADFFGRSLRSCDFSAVYTLRWKHIESAEDIVALKYPSTFDIQNANYFERSISGSDFSLVSGLRWMNIEKASDISGIKYPAGFDIDNVSFAGRDISGSDFSLVSGLRWEHLRDAASIENIVYPKEFDLSDVDFRGMDIAGSDFSRVGSFSYNNIAGAADIRRIKYPECYDSTQARYKGLDISGSNFSRVSTLRFAHIKDAADIRRLVYPPQFDIDEADYTGRDIDFSDFSLLPGINWDSIKLAESRESIIYPSSFVEPKTSTDEAQGSMLIFLLKLYNSEYHNEVDISKFYDDISALYPGIDDVKAAELIDSATKRWEQPDGKRLVELMARESHVGDKLFMVKLGFKLLYPRHGLTETVSILREQFGGLFKKHEKERFEKRLDELSRGRYLSAAELSDIGFVPVAPQKTERFVPVEDNESSENEIIIDVAPRHSGEDVSVSAADSSDEVDKIDEQTLLDANVHSFGYVKPETIEAPSTEGGIPIDEVIPVQSEQQTAETAVSEPVRLDAPPALEPVDLSSGTPLTAAVAEAARSAANTPAAGTSEPMADDPFKPVMIATGNPSTHDAPQRPTAYGQPSMDRYVAKPVDLSKLRQQRAAAQHPVQPLSRKEKLTDEEKGIRTGVMGMLLYIHENSSDDVLTNAELFSEFMKIYPGSAPKEAAAMAQFATDTLRGNDAQMKAKLFMFASRAQSQIKRKLLDFAYEQYVYRLSETADEEIFRDFLRALCDTLYEDSPEYEYSSYLRSRDILKDPPLRRDASYQRISFDSSIGKANLYANERYPYYRTLEQVGFQHFTFDAIRGNLLIEVSDSRHYEELKNLVYRERTPNLLQFIIIDTPMGYLYLEQRCIDDWQVDSRDVWAAAERNMRTVDMRARYSFASGEFSSFRYIQHDLASYILAMPDLMRELSCGQDLIISIPCREIVYIDFYEFGAIKKMLEFSSRYNCTLIINGEEYEHPFSPDVFIYHAKDGTFERVNDETYILLGDSVARRQVLRSVLPLNVDFTQNMLTTPLTTDDLPAINEEQVMVQEAIFTILRLYAEMNGENDYTVPQNAMMAVVDELYITFDAVYPPQRGRERPDPIDHIDEAAKMASRGGKTVCWLMIQALQYLCGDIKYETPSSAHIRDTVLNTIYGSNANAVWLNCATANDFVKRNESVRKLNERPVDNHHLTILDSKVEVAMHVLTMIFHQFSHCYALGQVRRHIVSAVPDMQFTYEINQSAWLPSPGDDVDVDAQSLGMIFRGFDRASQERMLTAFADSIGDKDLSEGGWPLLYFIKFVKYSYLDPVEMVERYFVRRSRLIPSQTVLKQLYYKDLNNEFVKHSRKAGKAEVSDYDDAFETGKHDSLPGVTEAADPLSALLKMEDDKIMGTPVVLPKQEEQYTFQRPDLQLAPVETGYLEKRLSFVLEEVDQQAANSLREAAHYVTKVFHVPEVMFKANDDIECELHYGIIRSREQITTLRSFAYTLGKAMADSDRDMRDVSEKDVTRAVEIVDDNNRISYKPDTKIFPVLCSMPLDEGMYIPSHQQYIFFAQELLPESKLASLFTLQEELMLLAPSMKLAYDLLREQKRGEIMPPGGVLFDVLCAWSAFSFSAGAAFELVKGPQMYNYNQIMR